MHGPASMRRAPRLGNMRSMGKGSAAAVTDPTRFRFRPRGAGRFFVAGFLMFWLCGWAAGEVFALWFLWTALTTAQGPLPVVAFLLLWVTLWSLGGIGALREVLRCLWSEDRLVLHGDGRLERVVRLGPFRRRRSLPLSQIHRFRVEADAARGEALVADLPGGAIEITRLGSLRERQEAAEQLNQALGRHGVAAEPEPPPAVLPPGWEELTPSFGSPLLVSDQGLRRRQALVMALVNLVVWGGLALLVRGALSSAGLWVPVVPLGVVALACGWGLLWLLAGRREWRLEPRRLVLQRRFGGRLRTLGEAHGVELSETIDSDGDRWYRLQATGSGGPPLTIAKGAHDPA
jgi:hypothetical protein